MSAADTYPYNVRCLNCGHSNPAQIPKGTSVHKYSQQTKCRNCDCPLYSDAYDGSELEDWEDFK